MTIIDTLHKEGKPQTFIVKEAVCSQSDVSKHVNRVEWKEKVKSSHLYLYSTFNNKNCVKASAQYQNRIIFELKAFHYLIQGCHCPAHFSLNSRAVVGYLSPDSRHFSIVSDLSWTRWYLDSDFQSKTTNVNLARLFGKWVM